MEWLLIYLFVMIERVGAMLMFGWAFFWVGCVLLVAAFAASGIMSSAYNANSTFKDHWTDNAFVKLLKRASKFMIPLGFVMGTIGFLMPTQKDAAIIIGSGITYNVLTSETGKRIGGKAVELLEQKIDSVLNEEMPIVPEKAQGKAL